VPGGLIGRIKSVNYSPRKPGLYCQLLVCHRNQDIVTLTEQVTHKHRDHAQRVFVIGDAFIKLILLFAIGTCSLWSRGDTRGTRHVLVNRSELEEKTTIKNIADLTDPELAKSLLNWKALFKLVTSNTEVRREAMSAIHKESLDSSVSLGKTALVWLGLESNDPDPIGSGFLEIVASFSAVLHRDSLPIL